MTVTAESWAVLAMILVPSAVVCLAAIVRGYHIHIIRPRNNDDQGSE